MEDKNAPIVLRNTMRRPLIFRVAGKTVRLSPGEELKASESWLGSAELQRLCGAGLVDARRPGAAAAARSGRAGTARSEPDEADESHDADDDREAKRSKSAKPKKSKPET